MKADATAEEKKFCMQETFAYRRALVTDGGVRVKVLQEKFPLLFHRDEVMCLTALSLSLSLSHTDSTHVFIVNSALHVNA